jgi:hypothetical protein
VAEKVEVEDKIERVGGKIGLRTGRRNKRI